jgi:hypothetical protein
MYKEVPVMEVPVMLIQTWIYMARNESANPKVKKRALFMLIETLGSNENIALYMRANGLK